MWSMVILQQINTNSKHHIIKSENNCCLHPAPQLRTRAAVPPLHTPSCRAPGRLCLQVRTNIFTDRNTCLPFITYVLTCLLRISVQQLCSLVHVFGKQHNRSECEVTFVLKLPAELLGISNCIFRHAPFYVNLKFVTFSTNKWITKPAQSKKGDRQDTYHAWKEIRKAHRLARSPEWSI